MSRLTEKLNALDGKLHLIDLFAALLMTCGLSLSILSSVTGLFPVPVCLLWCAAGILTVWGITLLGRTGKWLPVLTALLLLISQVILYFFRRGLFFAAGQVIRAFMLRLREDGGAFDFFARQITCVFSYTIAVFVTVFAMQRTAGACAAFSVGILTASALLGGGSRETLLFAVPVMAGLALMLCGERKNGRWCALPVCALLACLAFLMIPPAPVTASPFSDAANRIRETVDDYLLYKGDRVHFSLAPEGYLPFSAYLGGKADPNLQEALKVRGRGSIYLRAMSYNEYGYGEDRYQNWMDSLPKYRYLYTANNNRTLREQVFDALLPAGNGFETEKTAEVTILKSATSTVYVPQRLRKLTPLGKRMVLYWNSAGEVFITRNLEPGDSYTFSYLSLSAGDENTARWIGACEEVRDDRYDLMRSQYLDYPREYLNTDMFRIALEAAGDGVTPYEKAMNIARYLKKNYTYSLDVSDPVPGVDFCAHFLLAEKKGYCTYFATAMTLLCRMNGIPARYVTGYTARLPAEGGEKVLTGEDAHAWTEIYLNGFGWLTVDATPGDEEGDGTGDDPSGNGADDPDANESGEAAPTPTPPPATTPSPSPAPTPTPEPSTSPSPSPDAREDDEDRRKDEPDEDGEHMPAQSPTPPPGEKPTHAPSPGKDEDGENGLEEDEDGSYDEQGEEKPELWWLLILALVLLGSVVLRVRLTEPHRRAKRHPSRTREIWTAALVNALRVYGLTRNESETLRCFGKRAESAPGVKGKGVYAALEEIGACRYGNRRAGVQRTVPAYEKLFAGMNLWQRLKLVLRRTVSRLP